MPLITPVVAPTQDRSPHRANDPERRALPLIDKAIADAYRLVTRKAIGAHFGSSPGAVSGWTEYPTFPRPVALLSATTHPALLYPSGVVTRWVRRYRPEHLPGITPSPEG